jgi:transmembrane sensor
MSDTRLYYLVELATLGLLSEAEEHELNSWLEADPANELAYVEIGRILEIGSLAMASVDVQTDAEWDRLNTEISRPVITPAAQAAPTHISPMAARPSLWSSRRVWSAAAAIALLAVVGSYYAFFKPDAKPLDALHFATALGETQKIQLADGSQVTLNGGSTLDAAAGYGAADRRLKLHGEAYFEVAKDKSRPFVVSAGATEAEALGTKFNVRMAAADGSVQLSVTEGRVRFSAAKFQELILTEGQVANFDPQKGFVREVIVAQDAAAWVDKRLIFKDIAFHKAAEQIERTFGVTMHFPESLNDAPLTANFDRKPLSDVLAVLTTTFGVKISQDGKVVTLSE